jgi:hypothetical protein
VGRTPWSARPPRTLFATEINWVWLRTSRPWQVTEAPSLVGQAVSPAGTSATGCQTRGGFPVSQTDVWNAGAPQC